MSWRRLPGAPRLLVHESSGRSAAPVRSLAGSSDWRRAAGDRVSAAALTVIGADLLPVAPGPDWPTSDPTQLVDELRHLLPGLDLLGAVVPRQRDRERLSLIGRSSGNMVVIKLGRPGDGLEREADVLARLERHPLPSIATPAVIAAGRVDIAGCPVAVLATTAIALHRQRAAIDEPLRTFESDLERRLGDLPGRPEADTSAVIPVHGDLTPWNLRRTPRGLALFDWEAAGWGCRGSDLAHYRRACDEVRRPWNRSRSRR